MANLDPSASRICRLVVGCEALKLILLAASASREASLVAALAVVTGGPTIAWAVELTQP